MAPAAVSAAQQESEEQARIELVVELIRRTFFDRKRNGGSSSATARGILPRSHIARSQTMVARQPACAVISTLAWIG